ncbi:MAG: hypothetical protein COA46_08580 [Porticoccaceae bacterium]|nr:MAG: hypothetical protein COA46_08580 [Porticoccaceae bacterium]
MSTRMTADLTCDALSMALWRRGFPKETMVHSDRGRRIAQTPTEKLSTNINSSRA